MADPKDLTFRVRNVLIDVDGTVTEFRTEEAGGVFAEVLVSMAARQLGISDDQAERRIREAYDPSRECVSRAAERLGIDRISYWRAVVQRLKDGLHVYPDAVSMIRTLHARGFALYPATTNSAFAISAKLAVGGLAKDMTVPFYDGLGGGSEIHPEGKSGPAFYRALMSQFGLDPDETVMVGDDPTADLLYARQAGISAVILVRRGQELDCISLEDRGISVRSLDLVPEMLELKEV